MTRHVLALSALCGFLFFYGIDTGDLWRTEGLRAIVAAEGLRTGDWLVPRLYGQPLFTKPPGMYVAVAAVSWPLGEVRAWTARLPSALAATATVFLFYFAFGRQLGRRAGFVAALILPLSVVWLDKAPSAEIDMLQVFWVSAAILAFLRALEAEEAKGQGDKGTRGQGDSPSQASRRSPWLPVSLSPCPAFWWLLALLCVAGGVLTKWTAPVFFYGTAVPLLWWRGRLRLLFGRRHMLSTALAFLVCAGWVVFAGQRGGWDEFTAAVGREASQHLSPGHRAEALAQMGDNHHGRLGYWGEVLLHPLKVFAMMLPWSALALLTLRPGFAQLWDERGRRLLQALHCWAWPSLLFWSVVPQHSVRHSIPLCPAVAGLAALAWVAWADGRLTSRDREGVVSAPLPYSRGSSRKLPVILLTSFVVAWLSVKLAFVHAVVPPRTAEREPRAKGEQLAALVPAGKTLLLCRVKDEGIMFYYGRPVRRLAGWDQLPSYAEPMYCILEETEWARWPRSRPAEVLRRLTDEQGAPLVLLRVEAP